MTTTGQSLASIATPAWQAPRSLRSFSALILPGALLAAALDAAFSTVALVLVLGRYSVLGVLQYIASGLLGPGAFHGGVATAALGLLMHFALALFFAALYALVVGAVRSMRRGNAALLGILYGAGIWIVMDLVVLPFTGVPKSHDGALYFLAFLADHALLVGLPIALLTRSGLRRREAASA